MAKPEVPDIVISVDLGGSLTKIAASTNDGRHCLLALASEVGEIPIETLKDFQSGAWGSGSPETNAWVGVKNGSAYAVGVLARNRFKSQIDLKISKTELAVPKILSALWVLQQKLGLNSVFYARLGVLLPAGECSSLDQQELVELLKPALTGFTTPAGKMSVRLFNKPVIKPEGGGVFLHYKNAKEQLEQKRTGILGIGYRNANLLICDRGTIGEGDRLTSDLGFHTLIQRCREQVGSTVSDVELASIIAKSGHDINSRIVTRFLEKHGKQRRLEGFIEAIVKSQSMYMSLLINWLKYVGIEQLDDLVLYGGTAEYFKEPLISHLKDRVGRISWHSEVTVPPKLIQESAAEEDQSELNYRFIDVWCFQQFILERQSGYEPYGAKVLVEAEA